MWADRISGFILPADTHVVLTDNWLWLELIKGTNQSLLETPMPSWHGGEEGQYVQS